MRGFGFFPAFLRAGNRLNGPSSKPKRRFRYLSTNLVAPLATPRLADKMHGVPLIMGGYTRMFETGHALDYGVAFAKTIDSTHSIQFEARDYWAFANPNQHNVVFRVVWLVGTPDD
jgi:hypothetical protein